MGVGPGNLKATPNLLLEGRVRTWGKKRRVFWRENAAPLPASAPNRRQESLLLPWWRSGPAVLADLPAVQSSIVESWTPWRFFLGFVLSTGILQYLVTRSGPAPGAPRSFQEGTSMMRTKPAQPTPATYSRLHAQHSWLTESSCYSFLIPHPPRCPGHTSFSTPP